MLKEELVVDEIYKASNGNLFMWDGKDSSYYLGNGNTQFFVGSGSFSGGISNTKNSTLEEKHWLKECIHYKKFMSKHEALKTFNVKIDLKDIDSLISEFNDILC